MRRFWLGVVLLSLGCADEIPENVSQEMEARRAAQQAASDTSAAQDPAELLRHAPPGGHADWIRDIRSGLDTVPALAAVDRGDALHTVQELYARRYEPLRQFYGAGGAINAGAAVATAVEEAGTRLQQLMQQLASTDAQAESIEAAVAASRDALTRVEEAARAAGLPPIAPRDQAEPVS